MIADEDVTHRLSELQHVIKCSLLESGVMGALRAQMRAAALETLQFANQDAITDILGVHKPPAPPSGSGASSAVISAERAALLLVYDYLNHFTTLRRSAGVFNEESGIASQQHGQPHDEALRESRMLAQQLGVPQKPPTAAASEPLLVSVIQRLAQSGTPSSPTSASSATAKPAATATQDTALPPASSKNTSAAPASVSPSSAAPKQQPVTAQGFLAAMSATVDPQAVADLTKLAKSDDLRDSVVAAANADALRARDKSEAADWDDLQDAQDKPLPSGAKQLSSTPVPPQQQQTSRAAPGEAPNVAALLPGRAVPTLDAPRAGLLPRLAPLDPIVSAPAAADAAAGDAPVKKKKAKTGTKKKKAAASSSTLSSPASASGDAHNDGDDVSNTTSDNDNDNSLSSARGDNSVAPAQQPAQNAAAAAPATNAPPPAAAEPSYDDDFDDDAF